MQRTSGIMRVEREASMLTLEVIALVLGGAFVLYVLCAISYSIGLSRGIKYMTDIMHRESEDTE